MPIWSDHQYAMVSAIPRHTGKSAWQNSRCRSCGKVEVGDDTATCPICLGPLLRPVVKSRNGRFRLVNGFRNSTYKRMNSDRPAATITTATGHVGSNNTIHPFENRLLSTYECALLQTLPPSFNWGDALSKWGHTNVRAMIGEAVPPLFTFKHGHVIKAILEGRLRVRTMSSSQQALTKARKKLGLENPTSTLPSRA